MITVIIAGGSGTRLWPLSTPDYPKHLLKLVGEKTLIQSTYERASLLGDDVYVVTESSHANHVIEQLPLLDKSRIIIEPARMGTAHCIVMALDVISRLHKSNEIIAFIHADHHIRDEDAFRRSFKIAAETSKKRNEITLIGIEPTFPATGFGYIERNKPIEEDTGVYTVGLFKEKPDFETAKKYVNSGNYLWNCGYFVGSIEVFCKEMAKYAPDLKSVYDSLHKIKDVYSKQYKETYLKLDNKVIDTSLIEKSKNLSVVSASFDWMDIGSFKDLHEANDSDEKGNHFSGNLIYDDEVENVFIRNDENKPVVVIGLDNVVVINSPNGLLVARKDLSQKVKDSVSRMNSD